MFYVNAIPTDQNQKPIVYAFHYRKQAETAAEVMRNERKIFASDYEIVSKTVKGIPIDMLVANQIEELSEYAYSDIEVYDDKMNMIHNLDLTDRSIHMPSETVESI